MLFKDDHYLLVDGNNVACREHHALKRSISLDTHVIYGFFRVLASYQGIVGSNKFIFCWDEGKPKRCEHYALYKANRKKDEDWIKAQGQMKLLQYELLSKLGFKNNFYSSGYEADDLIASLVIENKDKDFTIVSSDKDLYQLLRYGAQILDPNKSHILNKKSFVNNYGIKPSLWWKVKAIAGCRSDNVPGCRDGIGEKTAIKYLLGKMNPKLDSYKQIKGFDLEANKRLVKLPYPDTPKFKIVDDNLSREEWAKMMDKYKFRKLKHLFPGD